MVEVSVNSTWSFKLAIENLGITMIPFEPQDSTSEGYSTGTSLALKHDGDQIVALHELAHIVLGHTSFVGMFIPSIVKELEAQLAAMEIARALGASTVTKDGSDVQVYIENYLRYLDPETMGTPNDAAIVDAAVTILRAGLPGGGVDLKLHEVGIDQHSFSL